MVAIAAQKVIPCPQVLTTDLLNNRINLSRRMEGKALQNTRSKRSTRRFRARRGVVHTSLIALIVAAVCVFVVSDDDAGMEEGGADGVEEAA